MKISNISIASVIAFFTAAPAFAATSVPITVQEAIYPGSVAGINRTNEPFCQGIPVADSAAITNTNVLGLTGATAGQFRILGRWPSGNAKWIEVCGIIPSLTGGATTSVTLTDSGSGNFGGANLASDNGATITVNTGAATFTIKKARFNVVDQAVIGGTTVVSSGSSQGLVITGPPANAGYPANVTCTAGSCTVPYMSSNDPNSTCLIEKNGPVQAVLKCSGDHVDSSGNVYLHFTVREYFYLGKTVVKVTSVLRNADYGTSNTFATAYKGHQGYELRLTPNLGGTANYSFGNHTSAPTTGTLTGSDSVYLYQGESQQMKWQDWCGFGCVTYTNDTGYQIVKNGTALTTGVDTQYPQGWADVSNAAGAGIEIGVYQLSAYWPKSLEFNAGATDVRIGIWARQNSQPYYQAWPQWSIHDLFLNFHATAPASPANEFLKFQHYLLARAPYTYYNTTGVFPYTLVDPTVEDGFYASTGSSANPSTISPSAACCIQDYGTADIFHWPLNIYRFYAWHSGGGANQTEFRWSGLLNFLTRGMTGRYLDASHFYRMQSEISWPHSDGFNWRDKPHANQSNPELDGFGFPTATSANSTLATSKDWLDQEHGHWYGMTDYYFMTGDETTHDALVDGPKDWFLNADTYQNGLAGGLYNSRAIGVQLVGSARFSQFLAATGDTDSPAVLNQGANTYAIQVKPDLCVSGYPNGCSIGQIDANLGGSWTTQGVSRVRGVPWGAAGTTGSWCGVAHAYRTQSSFQASILIQGILEMRMAQGPAWTDYSNALDLAYGIARWNLSENYVDNGSGRWDVNGFRFSLVLDRANSCTGAGESPEPDFQPTPTQTTAMTFLAKYLVDRDTTWATKFKINLQKDMAALGTNTSDLGSYQLSNIVGIISNPGNVTLSNIQITGFSDLGGGSYSVSWTVPNGTQSYRIKWGTKAIVDWVGFDPVNNVFIGDPVNTMPWFAANNFGSVPTPSSAGSTQSVTVSTGVTGLTAANFSVKAYVSGTGTTSSGPTTLVMVSGNGQTGTVSQALSAPLVTEVTDASGNPVSGVTVNFTVGSGGGSVNPTSTLTNSLGLASTSLTLGSTAGTNTVIASSGTLAGSPLTFTATGSSAGPGPATNLVLVSGNGQSGTAGQPLASPLVVKVTDANGNAVTGITVTFAVTSGGGALSATNVTTNSLGQASTNLVLGSTSGTNTVTAAAGSLLGSPITFTATGTSSTGGSGANVTWSNPSPTSPWPSFVGWLTLHFDPISKQTLIYAGPPNGVHGIYSTDIWAYNTATNIFTRIAGTGSTQDACPADTATLPGDRHPVGQMAIDTKRNILWLYGGVDAFCSSPSGPNANPRQDMYFLRLNSNPALDTWTQVTPAHIPLANSASAMIYDPDDDVLFAFGSDTGSQTNDHWVYCRTAENPTPGTLTSKQTTAGCRAADDWSQVAPVGGVQPPAVNFPGMVYDTVTKKAILYGGMSSGLTISYNQIWAYDIPTRTWTQKALSTTAPPAYTGSNVAQPAMAYVPATGKVLYHQTSGAGAPADWQYDPVSDTWTKLSSSGGGATYDQYLTYDTLNNKLIGFNLDTNTGLAAIWQGALAATTTARSCDLNQDGTVNVLDVQVAANQVLGVATCGSADLNGDNACTVTDLQRVVNASLGLACVVGP